MFSGKMLGMAQKINEKCLECALNYHRKFKPDNPNYRPKPECWSDTACPKKRSYYRNLYHYRDQQRKRHHYIKYAKDKCILCDSKEALEAHHITPQSEGGTHSRKNIMTLCATCHHTITKYQRACNSIQRNSL